MDSLLTSDPISVIQYLREEAPGGVGEARVNRPIGRVVARLGCGASQPPTQRPFGLPGDGAWRVPQEGWNRRGAVGAGTRALRQLVRRGVAIVRAVPRSCRTAEVCGSFRPDGGI